MLIWGFGLFPSHLPAALLASFAKRLSRLSLTAPPSSIVIIIPFVYNILKHHPALMCMIHRDNVTSEPFEGVCRYATRILFQNFISTERTDPFLADEPNPNLTNALDSSLWELYSHKTTITQGCRRSHAYLKRHSLSQVILWKTF